MKANPILLQKKYSRVIECFARQQEISLDAAGISADSRWCFRYALYERCVSCGRIKTGIC